MAGSLSDLSSSCPLRYWRGKADHILGDDAVGKVGAAREGDGNHARGGRSAGGLDGGQGDDRGLVGAVGAGVVDVNLHRAGGVAAEIEAVEFAPCGGTLRDPAGPGGGVLRVGLVEGPHGLLGTGFGEVEGGALLVALAGEARSAEVERQVAAQREGDQRRDERRDHQHRAAGPWGNRLWGAGDHQLATRLLRRR